MITFIKECWWKITAAFYNNSTPLILILVLLSLNFVIMVSFQMSVSSQAVPKIQKLHQTGFKTNSLQLVDSSDDVGAKTSSTKEETTTIMIKHRQQSSFDPFVDHWKTVNLSERITFHVYSAFYEDREKKEPFVRILGAISMKNKAFPYDTQCLIETNDKEVFVSPSRPQVEIQKEHFSLKWSSAFFKCFLTGFVKNVTSITKVAIAMKNQKAQYLPVHQWPKVRQEFKQKMGVCVKPFHNNFNRALWLTEFIEMYRLQGAQHFIFYNHTVGPDVQALLVHYQSLGLVSVLNWKLPLISKKDIRTEALFTAINDCNLRSVGKFQYLAIVDTDEFILPYKHESLTSLMDSKTKSNSGYFLFQNVFHYLYWENSTAKLEEKWPRITQHNQDRLPYLLTQTKLRRSKTPHKHGTRSKYVTRPEKVITVGNHVVWKLVNGFKQHKINQEDGLSHHYRICEFGGYDCLKNPSVNDTIALHWIDQLVAQVYQTCSTVFGAKSCPDSPPLGSPW